MQGPRQRARIAVVLSGYGVVRRGAETMLEEILARLDQRFEIHTYSRSGEGPGGIRRPAIPRTATERLYLSSRLATKVLDTLFLEPLHLEWTSHLLCSLPALVRGRYDVVWHETGLWGGFLMAGLRRWRGPRLLDVAQSNALGWEVPFARRRPDAYVVHTRGFATEIAARVPEVRIEIIPQGVDCERFRPGLEPWPLEVPPPVVVVAGALSPEKSPGLALEAVAQAGASLVLAGSGPMAGELDRRAAERLDAGRYQRLVLPREEMPRLYNAADVVVLASPRESGPMTALEALACGRPLVTAADPGRREIVGDAGVLVERQESSAYAAGIAAALEGEWGARARECALGFSLERTAAQFGDLLEELAGGRR